MDATVLLDEIERVLRERFPGRREETYGDAVLRVCFEAERGGPVSDVDRMFLGGPGGDASDAEVLVERTLVGIRERNAMAAGGLEAADRMYPLYRLREDGSIERVGPRLADLEVAFARLREAAQAVLCVVNARGMSAWEVRAAAGLILTLALDMDPDCPLCAAGHVPAAGACGA